MRNSDQTQTKDFILKGNILYAKSPQEIVTVDGGYLLCVDGKSVGVYDHIPPIYEDMPVTDYGDCLIIPGLNDLHVHAPQFLFRGLGMDCELLEWLERYAFPEEARYSDPTYANDGYNIFVDALKKSPTTRASVFATAHTDATLVLMKLLEESGLKTYVGRVNMDRNSSPLLQEESADFSITETERWIHESLARFENTRPILTPRFIPTCSDEVMEGLGALQKTYGLPLQSHLSENLGEIAWVKELCPWSEFYGDAYDHFGVFGGDCPTIMAHCVHSTEKEVERMRERGVFVAHCPQSNMNVSSGIAPIRRYLDQGLKIGLASDVAGGSSLSMFRAITDAVQVSKLYWRLVDDSRPALSAWDAFYMATKGGGEFFCQTEGANVGSFEAGYELDALVIDDSSMRRPYEFTTLERVERMFYLANDDFLIHKYVSGRQIF